MAGYGNSPAILMVLVFSLFLNFYIGFSQNSKTDDYINQSVAFQQIDTHILHPLLTSKLAKRIPVLINDSFKNTAFNFSTEDPKAGASESTSEDINNRNVWVVKYFNGVTLDEAIKSNSEIDNTAQKIVGSEKNSRKKAYLLYTWISNHIQYDDEKANLIVTDPSEVSSGSIVAYNEKKGVCFDYSCLYVSMCRAVGVKVRFITGLGYSGVAWGDHAWNQVYYPAEKRWINVDTTFGSAGYNYFDLSDFSDSHQAAVIQGEW